MKGDQGSKASPSRQPNITQSIQSNSDNQQVQQIYGVSDSIASKSNSGILLSRNPQPVENGHSKKRSNDSTVRFISESKVSDFMIISPKTGAAAVNQPWKGSAKNQRGASLHIVTRQQQQSQSNFRFNQPRKNNSDVNALIIAQAAGRKAFVIGQNARIPNRNAQIKPDLKRSFLSELPGRRNEAKMRNQVTRSLRQAANESKQIFEGASQVYTA